MVRVTIQQGNNEYLETAAKGETLMEVIQKSEAKVVFPCNGNHTCGKCLVETSGQGLSSLQQEEAEMLGDKQGMRLACFAKVQGDCQIHMGEITGDRIQITGDMAALEADAIYDGKYGMAFDIGTTTVVGYLFSKDSVQAKAVLGEMNVQRVYGADVVSRIQYCVDHGVGVLCRLIREQINDMMCRLCNEVSVAKEEVDGVVVCGNTTMLHIFAGLNPASIAVAPFKSPSLFGCKVYPGFHDFDAVEAYLPSCISSYVGADITCAVLASNLSNQKKNTLLVDIGTNGEMVLCSGGKMYCCATAAGPAFEGAGISCGSGAVPGAIDSAKWEKGRIKCHTIEELPAKSICGSGILDVLASAVSHGAIMKNGKLNQEHGTRLTLDIGVYVTQEDIRMIQYAKAAIRAGMESLMKEQELGTEDIHKVILCGGFGNSLDPYSAEAIGMLPKGLAQKVETFGNGAGMGAGRILQNRQSLEAAERIADRVKVVELSASPFFMNKYIESMNF